LPLRAIGMPGTAKTSLGEQTAVRDGLLPIVVIASLNDPTEIKGMPYVKPDGSVGYTPPAWALEANAAPDGAVVIFDEVNDAPPSVQSALHRVILEGRVGDYQLNPNVRFVAFQNDAEHASNHHDLSAAFANRFGTLADWHAPDANAWAAWLLAAGNGQTAEAGERTATEETARVLAAWPAAYAAASALVASYIRRHPDALHVQPPSESPQASAGYPTRRSWEAATRAMAGAKIHGLDAEETDRFVGSFIGTPALSEFRAWEAALDLPDPSDVLDGKVAFRPDTARLDRTMVTLNACAALVTPKDAEKRDARETVLWSLIKANMAQADIAFSAVLALVRARVAHRCADAGAVLAVYQPLFAASGALS
jgi:MoxR-like ATPase